MIPEIAGALISGGSSLLGSIFGGLFGSNSQTQALNAQWKMMQNSMNWQHNERLDTQAYNSAEAEKNRAWQQQMVNQQNQYNSPQEQMKRLQAAGVNPYSVFNQGGISASGASAPSGGEARSSGWPSVSWAPAYGAQNLQAKAAMGSMLSQGVSNIAQAVKSIAEAKKLGVDTSLLKSSFDSLVKKAAADASTQEYLSKTQEIIAANQNKISRGTWQKIDKEIELLTSQDFATWQDMQESKARIVKLLASSGVDKENQRILSANTDEMIKESFNRNMKLLAAQTARELSSAEAEKSVARINNLSSEIREATKEAEKTTAAKTFEEEFTRQGIMTQEQQQALETARKNNDWYTYDKILSGVSAAVGAYVGIRSGMATVRPPQATGKEEYYYDTSGRESRRSTNYYYK